jgi:hypothetical protein
MIQGTNGRHLFQPRSSLLGFQLLNRLQAMVMWETIYSASKHGGVMLWNQHHDDRSGYCSPITNSV